MIAFTANWLYTPLERVDQPLLLVDDHVIADVSSRASREIPAGIRVVDFGDAVLAPGFVDIHIHGGAGHDVMFADASGLSAVEQLLSGHGVTSYFPTTVTVPLDQICSALEGLADAIEAASREDGSRGPPSPANSVYIWKGRFSAMCVAARIRWTIYFRLGWKHSTACGKRRAVIFGL